MTVGALRSKPGREFPDGEFRVGLSVSVIVHVAIACLVLREAFVRRLALRWALAGLVALLCLATVYGRYHYACDVVAGLLVFWPLARAAEFLQAAHGRRGARLRG